MAFSILVVCTGNICRSPLAERMLRQRLGVGGIVVTSAGTQALDGYPIDAPSALVLRELGGDPDGHVAKHLTRDLAHQADLILTAQGEHRSIVLNAEPSLFRRTFTLREFARLGAFLGPLPAPLTEAGVRTRITQVAEQRGWVAPPGEGGDDIGDPFGAGLDMARMIGRQISETVDATIAALGVPARR